MLVKASLALAENPFELMHVISEWAPPEVDVLVIEGQQAYGVGFGNPNDLFPLAELIGGVAGLLDPTVTIKLMPRYWTGGIPKEIRHKQLFENGVFTVKELQCFEGVTTKSKLHNVIDAASMGLFVLDRNSEVLNVPKKIRKLRQPSAIANDVTDTGKKSCNKQTGIRGRSASVASNEGGAKRHSRKKG